MIKKRSHILSYIFLALFIFAIGINLISGQVTVQHDLRIIVNVPSGIHENDPVFIAGNFNGWSPGKEQYQLTKRDGKFEIVLGGLLEDVYEFKITRGSWEKVASLQDGSDVKNTVVALRSDTSIFCNVPAWKDDFLQPEKKHTASANVRLLNATFYVPQLNTHRRISVYLPPKYKTTTQRYPVIYLQDGQNIFDDFTASFSEWNVDETVDSMIAKGRKSAIIVTIDNGPDRLQEYNPFYFEKFGEGKGNAYVDFLAKTLKPYIDSSFRTLKDKKNTVVAGSSMGGLISYYALLKYPETFGKAGVFSPAFWTAESIKPMTDSLGARVKGKVFFYMGEMEGDRYMDDMLDVAERLGAKSSAMIYTAVDPEGSHNEAAWRKWFGEFYNWILADGHNYIIKTKD